MDVIRKSSRNPDVSDQLIKKNGVMNLDIFSERQPKKTSLNDTTENNFDWNWKSSITSECNFNSQSCVPTPPDKSKRSNTRIRLKFANII